MKPSISRLQTFEHVEPFLSHLRAIPAFPSCSFLFVLKFFLSKHTHSSKHESLAASQVLALQARSRKGAWTFLPGQHDAHLLSLGQVWFGGVKIHGTVKWTSWEYSCNTSCKRKMVGYEVYIWSTWRIWRIWRIWSIWRIWRITRVGFVHTSRIYSNVWPSRASDTLGATS